MFSRNTFSGMRRVGMGVGISKAKLTKAMLEILIQLPENTTNLKETIIGHLGLLGQMSTMRELDSAWNDTKKKAARDYPERFVLDGRKVLSWNNGTVKIIDKKISLTNFKKLNELAEKDNCNANQMLSKLIRHYQKDQVK